MKDAQTDAEVIASTRRVPAQFAVVFDRHFDTIHRYLDRRAGRAVADELSGEVFRIAFEQRRRFRPLHESALPWLYGLATNLLLKHWRETTREARAFRLVGSDMDPLDNGDAIVDSRLDAEPLGRRLVAALADLPEGDRDVVVLIAWEELSYEEVAVALGIPVGTVRSRLNRARRKLRTSLDDADEFASPQRLASGKDAR
jgi:RNA polymerase sigma factor (sigma-70 family)